MSSCSSQLVSAVGFSNGWAELALNDAATVRAELLDRLLARRSGRGDRLRARPGGCSPWPVRRSVWRRPARHEHERARRTAIGSRMYSVLRVTSTQKLPIVGADRRTRPRTSAMATAMPTAAETKFWTVRPSHLGQVATSRLARVVLPVRVGDEADRRVEREVRGHGRSARGVERQAAWRRCSRNSQAIETRRTRAARPRTTRQPCSRAGSTPETR